AASGCSASTGIPLTHRGLSQGCTFVTAHADRELNINWQALARLDHTLVFYMGLTRADQIAGELSLGGLEENTPAAIVANGSRKNQRLIVTTLARLSHDIQKNAVQSPALIVVGEVVNLARELQPDNGITLIETDIQQQRLSA